MRPRFTDQLSKQLNLFENFLEVVSEFRRMVEAEVGNFYLRVDKKRRKTAPRQLKEMVTVILPETNELMKM